MAQEKITKVLENDSIVKYNYVWTTTTTSEVVNPKLLADVSALEADDISGQAVSALYVRKVMVMSHLSEGSNFNDYEHAVSLLDSNDNIWLSFSVETDGKYDFCDTQMPVSSEYSANANGDVKIGIGRNYNSTSHTFQSSIQPGCNVNITVEFGKIYQRPTVA